MTRESSGVSQSALEAKRVVKSRFYQWSARRRYIPQSRLRMIKEKKLGGAANFAIFESGRRTTWVAFLARFLCAALSRATTTKTLNPLLAVNGWWATWGVNYDDSSRFTSPPSISNAISSQLKSFFSFSLIPLLLKSLKATMETRNSIGNNIFFGVVCFGGFVLWQGIIGSGMWIYEIFVCLLIIGGSFRWAEKNIWNFLSKQMMQTIRRDEGSELTSGDETAEHTKENTANNRKVKQVLWKFYEVFPSGFSNYALKSQWFRPLRLPHRDESSGASCKLR